MKLSGAAQLVVTPTSMLSAAAAASGLLGSSNLGADVGAGLTCAADANGGAISAHSPPGQLF